MVRQLLFVQGAGEGVHDGWDSKLVASLEHELGTGHVVHYPGMPSEGAPDFSAWTAALTSELDGLEGGAILVGHSLGGTMLFHALAGRPEPGFGGLFVVAAPFFGKGGWSAGWIDDSGDVAARLPSALPVHLYQGTDDTIVSVAHVQLYAKAIPHAVVHVAEGRDHQFNDDMREIARDIRALG